MDFHYNPALGLSILARPSNKFEAVARVMSETYMPNTPEADAEGTMILWTSVLSGSVTYAHVITHNHTLKNSGALRREWIGSQLSFGSDEMFPDSTDCVPLSDWPAEEVMQVHICALFIAYFYSKTRLCTRTHLPRYRMICISWITVAHALTRLLPLIVALTQAVLRMAPSYNVSFCVRVQNVGFIEFTMTDSWQIRELYCIHEGFGFSSQRIQVSKVWV